MSKPGEITDRQRAKQLRDYSGLCFDSITPTDIDGVIEYQNRGYIFIELKLEDAPMDKGQRLAFERLTDDLAKIKPTIFLIVSHNQLDPEKDIDVANAIVSEYRYKKHWRIPKSHLAVKEAVEWFLKHRLK